MHFSTGTAASPTYQYGIVRINDCDGTRWDQIETSAGVYSWTKLDAQIAKWHDTNGSDIYFQITSCPTFHANGAWAGVPDYNLAVTGSSAVPDPTALAAFVTALMTRYGTKIKYLGPWNEPKLDGPVVYVGGTKTGTLAVGDVVTGASSGVTGTVTVVGSGYVDVKLSSASSAPFTVGEQVRKDGSNYIVNTTFRTRYYWHGSAAQLAALSRVVYQAAKAVTPSVLVASPDWVDVGGSGEYDHITAWGNASDGAGGTGKQWADFLAYHFYDFDMVAADVPGVYRSLSARLTALAAIQSGLGTTWDLYATEVGYQTSWQFYTLLGGQPAARVGMLERVAMGLAAADVKSCIYFNHEGQYSGAPATVAQVSASMQRVHDMFNGQTLYSAEFDYGHVGRLVTSVGTMLIDT